MMATAAKLPDLEVTILPPSYAEADSYDKRQPRCCRHAYDVSTRHAALPRYAATSAASRRQHGQFSLRQGYATATPIFSPSAMLRHNAAIASHESQRRWLPQWPQHTRRYFIDTRPVRTCQADVDASWLTTAVTT